MSDCPNFDPYSGLTAEAQTALDDIQGRTLFMCEAMRVPLWDCIPESVQTQIRAYMGTSRILPGSCICALLEGDAFIATALADDETYAAIPSILRWIHLYMPSPMFGNPERVAMWVSRQTRL